MPKIEIHKRKSKRRIILLVSLFFLSIIIYKLADRYLIQHVEVSVAFPVTEEKDDIDITNNSTDDNTKRNLEEGMASIIENNITNNSETSNTDTTFDSDIFSLDNRADTSLDEEVLDRSANTLSPGKVEAFEADDWNYLSDSISIQLEKVTQGLGSNTITYYVADVEVTDSSSLKAAFAKNQFGRNITQDTSIISSDNNAIFAINGDYYGFREDGIIIRNGIIFRDIPARTGLALYEDGAMKSYDEASITAEELIEEGVTQTLSFGPVLVQDSIATTDFGRTVIDTNWGNHSIQNANPRTGLGIISPNHYVFIVVDGRSKGYSKGMSLTEFAGVFEDLGCTDAYNLDGGGSSTMYFMGRVVNNPLGKSEERGVSDILYIN